MGRRSTSSTKSGKFMNPTDQARKYRPLLRTNSSFLPPVVQLYNQFCFFFAHRKRGQEKGVEKGTP